MNENASHDLVARLIEDNQDIWQQLLHNPFVEAMKTQGPGNATVTEGYKWYEVVSIAQLMPSVRKCSPLGIARLLVLHSPAGHRHRTRLQRPNTR